MDTKTIQILIAMVVYMAVVIAIGIYFAKKQTKTLKVIFSEADLSDLG